jgi:hypothetical protein
MSDLTGAVYLVRTICVRYTFIHSFYLLLKGPKGEFIRMILERTKYFLLNTVFIRLRTTRVGGTKVTVPTDPG